jgi:hypothetical protein
MDKKELIVLVNEWLNDNESFDLSTLSIDSACKVEELASEGRFGEHTDEVLDELHRLDACHF